MWTALRGALDDLIEHRELLVVIVRRDLRVRYKQAVIGAGWAMLAPLSTTLVFSLVFTRAVSVDTPVPYPLFAYSGLLVWGFFTSSLRSAATSLTGNYALVTKVRFPRMVLPMSSVAVALVDFFFAALVLAGLMLYCGATPGPGVVLLPVVLGLQIAFATGLGLWLALGNLFYRDVGLVFGLLIGLWMFVTSVVYPVSMIGGKTGAALLLLNPLNPMLDAFRASLFGLPMPAPSHLAYATLATVLLLASAVWSFQRLEARFAEAI
jgi:ABC-type polysaccharide/polyol phosphate export permease